MEKKIVNIREVYIISIEIKFTEKNLEQINNICSKFNLFKISFNWYWICITATSSTRCTATIFAVYINITA